jgi:hypothetical protein
MFIRRSIVDNVLKPDNTLKSGTCRMQRNSPSLIAYDTVRGDTAPGLKGLNRRFRIWAEAAVNRPRRRIPRTWSAVSQNLLQPPYHIPPRALAECRHWTTIRQRSPSQRPNDTIHHQTGTFLKISDCSLRCWPKDSVKGQAKIGRAPQSALKSEHRLTGCAGRNRGLARIWHWITAVANTEQVGIVWRWAARA